MGRGLLALILWLGLGFGFTELTVLALNAWTLRGRPPAEPTFATEALLSPHAGNASKWRRVQYQSASPGEESTASAY
jgi:hypothetical protein